jgi:hypothetical protein
MFSGRFRGAGERGATGALLSWKHAIDVCIHGSEPDTARQKGETYPRSENVLAADCLIRIRGNRATFGPPDLCRGWWEKKQIQYQTSTVSA